MTLVHMVLLRPSEVTRGWIHVYLPYIFVAQWLMKTWNCISLYVTLYWIFYSTSRSDCQFVGASKCLSSECLRYQRDFPSLCFGCLHNLSVIGPFLYLKLDRYVFAYWTWHRVNRRSPPPAEVSSYQPCPWLLCRWTVYYSFLSFFIHFSRFLFFSGFFSVFFSLTYLSPLFFRFSYDRRSMFCELLICLLLLQGV